MDRMSYRSGARGEHLSSKGYLEYIDHRLGFPRETLYGLCLAAVKSKTKTKPGVKVTYRGETERQIHTSSHHFVQVRKPIFFIHFTLTKDPHQMHHILQH